MKARTPSLSPWRQPRKMPKNITRYIEALKRRPASLRLLEWKRVIMVPGLDRGPDSAVLTY